MRVPTEQDYNAESREIEFCVDIYFNGLNSDPLRVTRNNYLMDLDLLDEACADGDTFVGVPSANEVSFNLYSEDGIFNPNNIHGAYYRKIGLGICLKVYIRPVAGDTNDIATQSELARFTHSELATKTQDEVKHSGLVDEPFEWEPLGVFYVTDWVTDLTGINVSVTGTDLLVNLFTSEKVRLPILTEYPMEDLITDFFTANGQSVTIVGDFTRNLPFAYINKDNNKFLQEFANGALAFIYSNHSGSFVVQSIDTILPVSHTLTDHDQIISINAKQSIVNSYDGITVVCEKPQLSKEISLLQNRAQAIEEEETLIISNQGFSSTPLYALSHVEVQSDADCEVTDISSSVFDISYKLVNNTALATNVNINFFGYIVEKLPITYSDETSNMLKIDNDYVQSEDYALHIKDLLTAYIRLPIPVLEVTTRGNPKYQPGDKVRIYSEKYGVDFTGWLIRQHFTYDGGLKCTITVLNSGIIGG